MDRTLLPTAPHSFALFRVTAVGTVCISRHDEHWSVRQGTAEAGTDYIESKGTLIFRPGECSAAVSVKIVEDDAFEPDETFTVHLRNAVGAQPRAIPLLDTNSPGCVSCTCLVCTVVLSGVSRALLLRVRRPFKAVAGSI